MEPLNTLTESKMAAFVAVGRALLELRDKQLYRDKHADFYEYCLIQWGLLPDDVEKYLALVEKVSSNA